MTPRSPVLPGADDAAPALAAFAAEVGPTGPVAVAGGMTQWDVGGTPADGTRIVRAPAGVVEHQPDEMIVRVRAGTPVGELDAALAERGQFVALDPPDPGRATVGGVVAVGRSGVRRLGRGPLRDCVLEIRYVSDAGHLVKAGGPVVKNVSGFDLCRLLVGSVGTLGLLAELVLRTHPLPATSRWLRGDSDPEPVVAALYRPSSVLWDGATTWVLLEGHPDDVSAQASLLGPGWSDVEGPPPLPSGPRLSVDPARLATVARDWPVGSFLAEVGVGTVHLDASVPAPARVPSPAGLHRAVKERFDPTGRLNPGRVVP